MRLFLSSFGLSNDPAALIHLAGSSRRVAVVVNALDNFPAARSEWLVQQMNALADLGFEVVELDLRKFFSAGDALAQFLSDVGLVWINGGNAFILRRAMRQSGFDVQIKLLLSRNQIVYAGFSAAAVVAGPTLRGFELVDDPFDAPQPYENEIVWDGLGLIPDVVAVHFEAKDAQGEAMNGVIDRLAAAEIPYFTLRDGYALVVNGSLQTVVGGEP
jgi:dipeptidase E